METRVAHKAVLKVDGFSPVRVSDLDDAYHAHQRMRLACLEVKGENIGRAVVTWGGETYTVSPNGNIWRADGSLYHGQRYCGPVVSYGKEVGE